MSLPRRESETASRDETDLRLDCEWTTRILTRFVSREIGRTGRARAVLGLSGGIDSALSAYLAARALGPDNVVAVRMPYRTSSPDSLSDAQKVVDHLGIGCETVEITDMVESFPQGAQAASRLRLGNVMARVRMTVLFDRSEVYEGLVVGSSNKTELLLGYGTLFGDMASAVNPLGDLFKTQVRELAAHLGVPRSIVDKPPSADLWPNQTDEDELGLRYADVDRLLALLVDARVGRDSAIAAGFAPEMVDRIRRTIVRSQFKRHPPIIAKVSTRTVGWDFRYPRDWGT